MFGTNFSFIIFENPKILFIMLLSLHLLSKIRTVATIALIVKLGWRQDFYSGFYQNQLCYNATAP